MFKILIDAASLNIAPVLYFIGYTSLTVILFVIWYTSTENMQNSNTLFWSFKQFSVSSRVAFICLFFAFAGIPPFYFFFCKLSVFNFLLANAGWVCVLCFVLLVMLTWYSYYSNINVTVNATEIMPKEDKVETSSGVVITTCVAVLVLGWYMFDDVILIATWLSL